MGRTKYSAEERTKMIAAFLRAAREIIDLEGITQVSIRKVAAQVGCNSATMYLYFLDADELITLASMSYLESYCRTLAADIPQLPSAYERYIHTWRVFCQYAFAQPQVFFHLFYHPHSRPLAETVERYYEIYPQQLEQISGTLREMLHAGTLENRNMKILWPLVEEGRILENHLELINDLTICYFRKLLEERCGQEGALAGERLTEKMLTLLHFFLEGNP